MPRRRTTSDSTESPRSGVRRRARAKPARELVRSREPELTFADVVSKVLDQVTEVASRADEAASDVVYIIESGNRRNLEIPSLEIAVGDANYAIDNVLSEYPLVPSLRLVLERNGVSPDDAIEIARRVDVSRGLSGVSSAVEHVTDIVLKDSPWSADSREELETAHSFFNDVAEAMEDVMMRLDLTAIEEIVITYLMRYAKLYRPGEAASVARAALYDTPISKTHRRGRWG